MIERAAGLRTSHMFIAWLGMLTAAAIAGLYGAYVVVTQGLVVTGMNNMVLWGLWIVADLSFIALSAGAFTVSVIIYVFRIEKFYALGRLAVFIGLIGYTMTLLTLVLDIGRPERFWFPLVYWNPSSVMLEIFWCIAMYTAVLTGEFLPAAAETHPLRRVPLLPTLAKAVRAAMPGLVVAGAVFSLLHQSSLGAFYGILVGRPLWAGTNMALLFLISAIAAGPSMTMFAILATSQLTRREIVPKALLSDMGKIVGGILVLYLLLKVWTIVSTSWNPVPSRGELLDLLASTPYSWSSWGLEVVAGTIVPAAIFLVPRLRQSTKALFVASGLVVLGLVANRWTVTMTGLMAYDFPPVSWVRGAGLPSLTVVLGPYVPTWPEWVTLAGVLAFGLLVYSLGIKYFPIVQTRKQD